MITAGLPAFMNGHNVWVSELAEYLGFALEAPWGGDAPMIPCRPPKSCRSQRGLQHLQSTQPSASRGLAGARGGPSRWRFGAIPKSAKPSLDSTNFRKNFVDLRTKSGQNKGMRTSNLRIATAFLGLGLAFGNIGCTGMDAPPPPPPPTTGSTAETEAEKPDPQCVKLNPDGSCAQWSD